MNMSLFKILNEVWFVKLHRDIVHHEENSRDKMSLVLVIKIYVCSNSNLEGAEDSVAQTIIEEKGAMGSQRWFDKTKGSTNSPLIPKLLPLQTDGLCNTTLNSLQNLEFKQT